MTKSTGPAAQRLTPYDLGDRLEPHLWVQSASPAPMPRHPATGLVTDDDFGWVDFDDDAGRTVLSLYIERTESGYVLRIDNMIEEVLTVTGDTEAIVLGIEHQAGISELIALAERGRRAFLDEARAGAHNQCQQDEATLRWVGAHNAAVAIRQQQPR